MTSSARYTVTEAVRTWLAVGLNGRAPKAIEKCRKLIDNHIVPQIGAARVRDLTADDLDEWLEGRAVTLETRTLRELLSIRRRSITLAQRRDLVVRNVAELVTIPKGTAGRPSTALTMDQALAVLAAAALSRLHAYIVVSLLTGIRTEEARALSWDRMHLHRIGENWTPRELRHYLRVTAVSSWRTGGVNLSTGRPGQHHRH